MTVEEVRDFARRFMREVREPFDSSALPRFYHRDVVGPHSRGDGSRQELGYEDTADRLDWDRETSTNAVYDVEDIVAEGDRFAIRFVYTADFLPADGKTDVDVMHFYRLRDGKISEWWLPGNADFDYTSTGTEGMPNR